MFNSDIKNLIEEINKTQSKITNIKNEFVKLKNEIELKEKRNYEKFKTRSEEIDIFESKLKSKFDNKYFNFIKYFDFLNEKDIVENVEFEIDEKIGCLIKRPETILSVNEVSKFLSTDKKSITFKLREKKIINSLEYSFYSKESRLPIMPKDIKVSYDEYVDNFKENYFRHFNLNNQKDFISKFIFEPKPIKEIVFYFNEDVNFENSYLKLFSVKYRKNNYVKFLVKNDKKIKTFNIYKKSNESFLNFNFYFSEDNNNYTKINFNNNNSIFTLENNQDFIIMIEASNEKKIKKDNYFIKTKTIESEKFLSEKNIFSIPISNINIETINIILPISSYEKLKVNLLKHELNIDDFVDNSAGVIKVKKQFIKNISESKSEVVDNLKFFDDEIILKTVKDSFDFYYNPNKNNIVTSSFLSKYPFYISFQYKEGQLDISDEYYTPMLFDFSIKG